MALSVVEIPPTVEPVITEVPSYTYTYSRAPTDGAVLLASANVFGQGVSGYATPSGWTPLYTGSQPRSGVVYHRIADSAETEVVFSSTAGSDIWNARIYEVTGHDPTWLEDSGFVESMVISQSYTPAPLVSATADCLSVVLMTCGRLRFYDGNDDTPPSGYSTLRWTPTSDNGCPGISLAYLQTAGTGTIAPSAWTTVASGSRGNIAHFLIRPEVAPPAGARSRMLPLPRRWI